ncbi:MAG: 16S rRNA (guanine(527)-N(7))-methyltransferase RsmG [Candidatus Babeliales bacterium]|jgi:16S rRNA (guanine527-N7)-methyltransferase
MKPVRQKPAEKVWADLQTDLGLSDLHIGQFQKYAELLMARNQEINLTAIEDLSGIVRQHFIDSVALRDAIDLTTITSICDVGTGAGFPGLPLKILFPHLKVTLIEVTKKKQQFLTEVIQMLGLENVEICDVDWRTFLRTTQHEIDLFVTRAALDEVELTRAFRASCPYRNATIVYWVTDVWEPNPKVAGYVKQLVTYKLAKKIRKLAFLKA